MPDSEPTAQESPAEPERTGPDAEQAVQADPPAPAAVEEAVDETPPPTPVPATVEAVDDAPPEPAPTKPEPAAKEPEPVPTKPKPAPSKPASKPLDGRIDERGDVIVDEDVLCREGMDWFVLRVASNKESSVRETLLRKIQIEKMDHFVGRILVPTEKTKTIKGGRQRITETKLYPGYVFVEMQLEEDGRIPQDVFFLIKETTGVGDFVGTAGRPTPMKSHEIEKMLLDSRKPEEEPEIKLVFTRGEHVVIKEGPFQGYEGSVDELLPEKGLVRVLVTIFGRQAPIELEEWQIVRAEDA